MAEGDTVSSTTTKTRPGASHPPFIQMVIDGMQANPDRKGSSIPSIKNYIMATYPTIEPSLVKHRLKKALAKAEEQGIIVRPKGAEEMKGAVGRFKLDKVKLAEMNKPKKSVKEVVKNDSSKKVPTAKATKTKTVKGGTKVAPKSLKTASKTGAKSATDKKTVAAGKTKTPSKQAAEKAKKLVKAAMTPTVKTKAAVKPKQPKSKTAAADGASKKKSPVAKKGK